MILRIQTGVRPLPSGSHRTASQLDQRLRCLATIFYGIGIVLVTFVANWQLTPIPMNRTILNTLVLFGIGACLLLLYLPWHRFHRNWLLLNTGGALALIVVLIRYSGGIQSPFIDYFYMVTVFSALYYRRRVAFLLGAVTSLLTLLPLLYNAPDPVFAWRLLVGAPIHLLLAYTGQLMVEELFHNRMEQHAINSRLAEAASAHQQALAAARTDALTQLMTRAPWLEQLDLALQKGVAEYAEFSILFLDVDHFKSINDRYGHDCGDDVLRQVAKLLERNSRPSDFTARYGGEEFVVLLSGVGSKTAPLLAERVRAAIAEHKFTSRRYPSGLQVTVSIGIAVFGEDGTTCEQLLTHADASMYRAKHTGRNRVHRLVPSQFLPAA